MLLSCQLSKGLIIPKWEKPSEDNPFLFRKVFQEKQLSAAFSCCEKNYNTVHEKQFRDAQKLNGKLVTQNEDPKMDSSADMDCIGTGLDVECVISNVTDDDDLQGEKLLPSSSSFEKSEKQEFDGMVNVILDTLILISPFFFWGTAMVAMKEVLPKRGSFFVAAVRLIPSGLLLIGFAQYSGKKQPAVFMSWLSVALFGLVDAACFQVVT